MVDLHLQGMGRAEGPVGSYTALATVFVSDTFTEVSDVLLSAHIGELGATWTKNGAATYGAIFNLLAATDRIFPISNPTAFYASGSPPSADYSVQCDIFVASDMSANIGPCIRMDTTADTMYQIRYNSGTTWELRRLVAGVAATIGTSTNQLISVGNSKTVKIVVSGTSLSVYINGVLEIGPVTDANISAAGKAGVRAAGTVTGSTGYHLDNFIAQ
jgi:hypothetical protein